MRLIDADTVKQDIYKYIKEEGRLINPYRMLDYIDSVETSKKAIPVEWIMNKYRGKWGKAEMGRRDFQFIEVIDELLAEWEKENQSLE